MDRLDNLEQQLYESGLEIDNHRHMLCDGYYRKYSDGFEYMAVAPDMPRKARTCVAFHEAGHRYTHVLGHAGRDDERANRWAVKRLVPLMRLIEALEQGSFNTHDISDYLGVAESFLKVSLSVYRKTYGLYTIEGDWVISFEPTVLAYNYVNGRFFPDD